MRFLNTITRRFENVSDSELHLPGNEYAILSHRWFKDEDEVTFQEIQTSADVAGKKGFAKIEGFCKLASRRKCRYAWIDTCCINKENPAELSEAINRMYRWYQESKLCIVYLADVPDISVMDSEWFGRGWTLQELIGPKSVSFYDRDWNKIGTKSDLLTELSRKTKIPETVLSHSVKPLSCSVAQRMSWAAERECSRVEDRAYSLVGLFGVSMNMTYGEREKAFVRLQLAIIQQSKDESIFAWALVAPDDDKPYSGLLASSPSSYINCQGIVSTPGSSGFSLTNGELSIRLKTYPHSMETYFATLHCADKNVPLTSTVFLVSRTTTDDEYLRVRDGHKVSTMSKTIFQLGPSKERLLRVPLDPTEPPLNRVYGFWLRSLEPPDHTRCQTTILSKRSTSDADYVCLGENDWGTAGIVYLEPKKGSRSSGWSKIRWIKFGFDVDFNPVLLLANGDNQYHEYSAQSSQLKVTPRLFDEAIAAGPESRQHDQVMNNRWIDAKAGVPHREHAWPIGVSILQLVRQKGMSGQIQALNLNVSVRLQPYRSPTTVSVKSTDSSGLPLGPRKVWVVDITDTGGRSPERESCEASFCCLQTTGETYQERAVIRSKLTRLEMQPLSPSA